MIGMKLTVLQMYYGEELCSALTAKGTKCTNFSYFGVDGRPFCGIHSKRISRRIDLPKNPNAAATRTKKIEDHKESVKKRRRRNRDAGKLGKIKLTKMRMMKPVELEHGYLNVFPNRRHGGRVDGYGCPELSPMVIGPIKHKMPGIPTATNIENFHQFAKVYECDTDTDGCINRAGIRALKRGYSDEEPHRHKYDRGDRPLYSRYIGRDGGIY